MQDTGMTSSRAKYGSKKPKDSEVVEAVRMLHEAQEAATGAIEVSRLLGASYPATYSALKRLVRAGQIERRGLDYFPPSAAPARTLVPLTSEQVERLRNGKPSDTVGAAGMGAPVAPTHIPVVVIPEGWRPSGMHVSHVRSGLPIRSTQKFDRIVLGRVALGRLFPWVKTANYSGLFVGVIVDSGRRVGIYATHPNDPAARRLSPYGNDFAFSGASLKKDFASPLKEPGGHYLTFDETVSWGRISVNEQFVPLMMATVRTVKAD